MPDEGRRLNEAGEIAEELELSFVERHLQAFQKQTPIGSRDRTRTGRKKLGRQATQRPSGARPPPGTTQWACG